MIDIAGATLACKQANSSLVLTQMGIAAASYANKASWTMAIDGVYALLYPLIYKDFPCRDEVQTYVYQRLLDSFTMHHASNVHLQGAQSTIIRPDFTLRGTLIPPVVVTISKKGRAIQDPTGTIESEVGVSPAPIEPILALASSRALAYLSM